jgi:hypothetical protein
MVTVVLALLASWLFFGLLIPFLDQIQSARQSHSMVCHGRTLSDLVPGRGQIIPVPDLHESNSSHLARPVVSLALND